MSGVVIGTWWVGVGWWLVCGLSVCLWVVVQQQQQQLQKQPQSQQQQLRCHLLLIGSVQPQQQQQQQLQQRRAMDGGKGCGRLVFGCWRCSSSM